MAGKRKAQIVAKAYVADVRSKTFCVECGRQPIDWHRSGHEQDHNSRVGPMMGRGVPPERIQAEIDLCIPLCRLCHMKLDGRLEKLIANRPFKKGDKQLPKPCHICGNLYKPLRRGRCNACNKRFRAGKGP